MGEIRLVWPDFRLSSEAMRLNVHNDPFGARASRLALLPLLCLVGLPCFGAAARPSSTSTPNSSSVVTASFAIADFDGDRKPDMATVEVQKVGSSARTQYSIRFELTAGTTQVFGVTAPAGGLQIIARDVNGDDALDLLVSTAWLHQQVAVLLNDGHGNFILADSGAYPASLRGCESRWSSEDRQLCDRAALIRSAYSAGDFEGKVQFEGLPAQAGCAAAPRFRGSTRLFLYSLLGRAPPTSVHQS